MERVKIFPFRSLAWRDKAVYDRILVAVDHSEMSDRAVIAARDLAALSKGEVWVLHLSDRPVLVVR
jgi:K+-sensing histidine kinase KdpD